MIREIVSSLWHNKARTVLITALNTLTFFLALITLTNSLAFYTQLSDVRKLFREDTRNTYRIDAAYIENEDNIGADFEELKALVNARENSVCGAYDITRTYFDELTDDPEFIALNKKAYPDNERYPALTETVYIDTEILKIVNFELTENDFRPVEKDGELFLPLYAGEDFNGVLSVGDTLTMTNSREKYIVAGFLNGKKWFDDSDPVTMPPVSLDHSFFAPFSELEKQLSENDFNMLHHATVGKIFMSCPPSVAEEFNARAMEKGIKFSVVSIYDFTKLWETNNKDSLAQLTFLAVIVLVCSAVSIVSTLCVNVLLKKREYGIKIAFGSTKGKIILSLGLEMIFLNVISGIIAFVLSYRSFAGNIIRSYREIYLRTLCSGSLLCSIGLALILTILVLFVPIKLLGRYDPASLIKEEE
ncbi:MAG: ABC transporter permease [Ruminococcaceae bacterium]|nr:ABC transporter permease [Oscillospiraceae bacterium]